MRALLVALCLALLAGVARAEDDFRDLDPETQRTLATAARAYLEPTVEFLWRPRQELLAALEDLRERTDIDALADIGFLREVVYQGRHFLPRFSDARWQKDNEVPAIETTEGIYRNLGSAGHRFTYTVPTSYPTDRAFARIPRSSPLPLLLAIHDERDAAEPYPGRAALARRYPRGRVGPLYEDWLTLAPVAARATFLEDGAIRHRFLTGVLTSFWRRYHVDFDRIVVDGGAPAAALAAAFPHVFAGLVLRPGQPIDLDVVRNYASVPVFVAGDEALARELEQHGHADVSVGDDDALLAWLGERRRHSTTRFTWRRKRPDHGYAHWVVVTEVDPTAEEVGLEVETVDTAADPNTIRIAARGVERLRIFLNDGIVDLDRPVRVVVNGEEERRAGVERDFRRLFEKEPRVRENMNFGWLFPALLADVVVAGPGAPRTGPAPEAPDRHPTLPDRLAAQQEWLEGRPDRIEVRLGAARDAVDARALLPFALRDLWWRPTGDVALRGRCADAARSSSDPVLADQLRWLVAGGGGTYPRHADATRDPWPILTALVLERQQRETTGARWLPDESPVRRRRVLDAPAEWQDWYARWCAWFYDDRMRTAYEGESPDRLPAAFVEADREQDRIADGVRVRNAWLAVLAGALFVGGAFVVGRRASRA